MSDLVSVIMTVYNSQNYLREAVESILNQSYRKLELIVVNDGSTDESLKILTEYSRRDARVKVITRENRGLVYSLNEAIQVANGKYIARMDSDDISSLQRIEIQLECFMADPTISVLGSYINAIGDVDLTEKLNTMRYFNSPVSNEIFYDRIFEYCPFCHPSVMFTKDFIEGIGGYQDYKVTEDWALWMEALKKGYKLVNIPLRLMNYRIRRDSKSFQESKTGQYFIEKANFKFRYLKCTEVEKRKSVIWGTGAGGRIAYEVMSKQFPMTPFLGFVDSFKEGEFMNYRIMHPTELLLEKPFVYIATTIGKEYAKNYLLREGFKQTEDFCYIL